MARFEDGAPAAILSTFGQGRTLMLGSCLSAAYQSTPTAEAERFFAGLLAWAGVTLPVTVTGAPLEVRSLESGGDTLVFLFNHGATAAQSAVSIDRPPGAYTVTDLVEGRLVSAERTERGLRLEASLAPSAVSVLRVARQ